VVPETAPPSVFEKKVFNKPERDIFRLLGDLSYSNLNKTGLPLFMPTFGKTGEVYAHDMLIYTKGI
jgi:hypothetical protein